MVEWFRASLSHLGMGSNPCHDTCVLGQDAHNTLLFTQGHKRVPARVEVDIKFEKAFGAPRQPEPV